MNTSVRDRLETSAEVVAISDYNDLIALTARGSKMRERLVHAAGIPLTRATLDVLVMISRHPNVGVSALARRLDVDQSTASRQLRPLEARGLISRTEDRADRRVVSLAVTHEGAEVVRRVRRVGDRDLGAALASWSRTDRECLGALLDRLREGLLEVGAARAAESTKEQRS